MNSLRQLIKIDHISQLWSTTNNPTRSLIKMAAFVNVDNTNKGSIMAVINTNPIH